MEKLLSQFKNNEIDFKRLVDSYKSIEDYNNEPCLYILLENKELFEELIQNNTLNKDDLRYLLNKIYRKIELYTLSKNTSLLKYVVDKNIVSFKDLVDKFRIFGELDFFGELDLLLENEKLCKEDLRYLLNIIDKSYEIYKLCNNTLLIKYVLNEFMLNKEYVDRFNTIIENSNWCKDRNIHTIFDLIEYWNKNNEEILKLNELNKKVYLLNSFDLTKDQKSEIAEVLKNNEIAQNRLMQIVDNNLESNYDFEKLMNYLKKKERKNLINI